MNIGKAASLSGLTIKTVRYYSDIGIIKPDTHS
ncbi:MerR family DNA-binding transcriptional regulator [Amylibacter sp.]|nr:MerR family DNA-binding transcriptional regulator [Amylibacter sp.]